MITLPEELRLEKNMTFNVVDDTGAVVAIAQTDVANKTVTLTYTDYVKTMPILWVFIFYKFD